MQIEGLRQQLEGHAVNLKLTVGENDSVFGSITAQDIAKALYKEGLSVEKAQIQLDQPIKGLGIYEIPIKLHGDVSATIKVFVAKA